MHFDPESNVVDVHVGNLRRKLMQAAGEPLLATVRGVGFSLRRGADAEISPSPLIAASRRAPARRRAPLHHHRTRSLRLPVSPDAAAIVWSVGLAVTGAPGRLAHAARHAVRPLRGRPRRDARHRRRRCSSASRSPGSSWSSCRPAARRSSATPRAAPREAVRELEAAAPRLAHRVTPRRRRGRRGRRRRGGRRAPRPARRAAALRRASCSSGRSHVDAARLTGEPVPVTAAAGVAPPERQPQPRRPAHRARHGAGEREPVRPHRRARAHGAGEQVAAAAPGRPLRGLVHAAHPAGLRSSPTSLTARSDPRARGARRGHALPAHPRHAGRDRGRHQPRRPPRDHLPPRLGARAARGASPSAVFDKTGTLTIGRPQVARVLAAPPFTEPETCSGSRAASSTAPATCSLAPSSTRRSRAESASPRRARSPRRPAKA